MISSMDNLQDLASAIRHIAKESGLSMENKTQIIQSMYAANTVKSEDKSWAEIIEETKEAVLGSAPSNEPPSSSAPNHEATYQSTPCSHYKRRNMIKAACCGNFYGCRLCHDELSEHKISRFDTKIMKCIPCGLEQPVSISCQNKQCSEPWEATYYCSTCKYWSMDANPKFFHCDGCGICRVGVRENYVHCDSCSMCVPTEANHHCIKEVAHNNCPVCFEYLQNSREEVHFLDCGHAMHSKCYRSFTSESVTNNFILKCPLCNKTAVSAANARELMSEYISQNPMPEEFREYRVEILCNDCQGHSSCAWHFVGHACELCHSYNTVVVQRIQQVNEENDGESE